jgi:hypothetical protein
MTTQLHFVQLKDRADEQARETVADFVAVRDGFVCMATSEGSLIVAIDDGHVDALRAHPLVEFASGVSLNPEGTAAAQLQRLFARNIASQLVARGWVPGTPDQEQPSPFPPGFRPLQWRTDAEGGG